MQHTLSANLVVLVLAVSQNTMGYSLPQQATLPLARALAISITRDGFTYGSSVGGGPFYPTGLLGVAKDAVDVTAEGLDSVAELTLTTADEVTAAVSTAKVCSRKLFPRVLWFRLIGHVV